MKYKHVLYWNLENLIRKTPTINTCNTSELTITVETVVWIDDKRL